MGTVSRALKSAWKYGLLEFILKALETVSYDFNQWKYRTKLELKQPEQKHSETELIWYGNVSMYMRVMAKMMCGFGENYYVIYCIYSIESWYHCY